MKGKMDLLFRRSPHLDALTYTHTHSKKGRKSSLYKNVPGNDYLQKYSLPGTFYRELH